MVVSSDTREMIKALDAERMAAVVSGDVDTLDRILADDLTYVHTSAAIDTKASIMDGIRSGRLSYKKMAPRDVQVRDYGDSAVLRGQADVEVTSSGNDLTFSLEFTEVYVNGDNGWQLVAWQSTRLPQ